MEFIDDQIIDYCLAHSDHETALLKRISRDTHLEVLHPRMLSGHLQGRFLSFVSQLIKPKRILELGTYTGYSAICLAEGLQKNGELITIDKNLELEERVKGYFSDFELGHQIDFRLGNALDEVKKLDGFFDLVFIDADKINYLNYLKALESKLKSGAVIVADNVLWSGKVVEEVSLKDKDTPALLEFNKYVQDSNSYENLLLPIRDGLMIFRKK